VIDYQASLFNPIYNELSVPATLVSGGGTSANISVIDHTTGVALTDRMSVESIRPVARVRTAELVANGIAFSDLPESQISFNGAAWRVKAHRQMPAPTGELTGETMLILLSEGL
jgi:hypothetical protein